MEALVEQLPGYLLGSTAGAMPHQTRYSAVLRIHSYGLSLDRGLEVARFGGWSE